MRYLLHDVFYDSFLKYPHKVAILEEDGRKLTYTDINNLSNQFAHLYLSLKANDVKKAPFVGILSAVHAHSICSILGALKIGCAYVPLDDASPVERLNYILDNTQIDILVIDPLFLKKFEPLLKHPSLKSIVLLDRDESKNMDSEKVYTFSQVLQQKKSDLPQLNQVSDDLSYILHSSGSTGIPKGIMLTHRNARTFVDWMHKEFALTTDDVVMSRAPFKFDLSVFDIFNTFKAGARLVCFNWNRKRNDTDRHKDYVLLMEREKATILYTTPSTFISLMNRGAIESANLSLRSVMYAGEPFSVPQLKRLKSLLPKTRIANIYGPTETNIITYYWIDAISETMDAIPLGYVVDDTEIIVVSEDQKRLCASHEVGELWCRGGTVTMGYLGMPEKTKENLVASPFHRYPCLFWRTGDFGFHDDEGLLHYRGRRDHMVKVKGYRIEIGEVEAAIAKFEGLDEFTVIAIPHPDWGHSLYCYFSRIRGTSFSINEVLSFLKTKLPPYMLPLEFIEMTLLPKTSSGKIDRILLAEILTKREQHVA